MHMSSGKTQTDLLLPEAATLIFPDLDQLAEADKQNSCGERSLPR